MQKALDGYDMEERLRECMQDDDALWQGGLLPAREAVRKGHLDGLSTRRRLQRSLPLNFYNASLCTKKARTETREAENG